ncbi:phage tail tape measure protein, partial [Staphylococcus haemolyticus]|uniref:phage tail tape measure protein n=1 Tax=Staphylococcus haemolyticus TaxID=1283 RepID=UPI0015D77D5F
QYDATSQEAQQLNAKLTEERVKLKELNGQLTQSTQAHNRLEMEQKQGISSMSQIRAKMTQFNDTLSLSRSNLARAGESVKAYKVHLDTLSGNLTKQRTVLRELSAQYKHVVNAQGENSQEARELASAITQQKIKMNEIETEIDETTQSYKRLAQEQKQAQYLSGSGLGKGIQTANKYKDSINNVGSSMRNVGSNMSMYFTLPVVAGFGAAIKTGADFEGQMSRVGAIAGSSKSQLKAMSNQAVDLGAKTSLSASEVAKGMEELAALGMNTNQIMKAMPGVISAAEASGSDLATTATIMASSLNS